VADLDNDGAVDLAVPGHDDDAVSIVFGIGDGTFADPVSFPSGGLDPWRVATADINGDGLIDIAAVNTNSDSNTMGVLVNLGERRFAPAVAIDTGRAPRWIEAADLNGDDLPDLLVANRGDNDLSIFLNRCAPCRADMDGDGALTLFDFLAYGVLYDLGSPLADFDGDGVLTIFDFLAFQNAFDAGCS
jgi:hypothetical protein